MTFEILVTYVCDASIDWEQPFDDFKKKSQIDMGNGIFFDRVHPYPFPAWETVYLN